MNDSTQTPGPGNPDRRDGHGPEPEPEPEGVTAGETVPRDDASDAVGPDGAEGTQRGEGSRDRDGLAPEDEDTEGARSGGTDSGVDSGDVDVDEEALRLLMHRAVGDLAPSPDSLEHLRRAVPVRRTRRRQALVGAVAAVVLGGAALPALVHVATTGGGADDRPANASSSHRTPGTAGGQRGGGSGGQYTDRPSDSVSPDKHDRRNGEKPDQPTKDPKGDSGGTAPDPSSTLNATSPICSRTQLGSATGTAGSADVEGRVYGSFRVSNVSDRACSVEGGGDVSASAQGAADSSRIFVVDHTAGDAASELPDPATQPGTLILQPGQTYEVRFAWVPASGGGTSGCSSGGGSTPTPDPSSGPDGAPQDEPSSGEPGGTPGGGEPPAASVLVSHTPEAGDPAAGSVTVSGACAGTIYRTGLLAAS
ncbi:hypothetical protein HUT19_21525 [Streptomyces sp. NA02950]|uniref:hypothetical protein n=1 Tax=Streptomyces sp. NA02950 TaxID=2742137 RepID=UPI001591931C|nr:hypothetical protein [Streptomyces sp. NA02950]QKV94018.1 hypothetical protein HUT19_21525 [Streptomyces sp. NA02950]